MANRTVCGDKTKGGNTSCGGDEGIEIKKRKAQRVAGRKEGKYLVTKEVYTNKSKTPDTKIKEESKLVVSDAIKEQNKPETGGVTFEGKTSEKTTKSSKGGEQTSKVSETKYFKRKGLVGRVLGDDYRQKGGKTETEENGKLTTVTYKGKGRKGRVKEEVGGKIDERDKKIYDTDVADIEKSKKNKDSDWVISGKQINLATLNYAKAKVSETKDEEGNVTSYKLGTPYSSNKEIRVRKKTYKADIGKSREGTVKMKKPELKSSLKRGNYGKA